jgi:hypothetical protein
VSSAALSATGAAEAVRGHWATENSLGARCHVR